MIKGIIGSVLSYILLAVTWHQGSAIEPNQHGSGDVKVIVERIERASQKEVHFRLTMVNESASPVFLEGRAIELFPEQTFPEQLYLEQWRDGEWHLVVPCLENAPSSVITLNPGMTISQDRVLTDPVESPCKERRVQFDGRFRFRLEYFLSEQDAKANERNVDSSGANVPAPHVALSDQFEIPTKPASTNLSLGSNN
jgi:hypothetical protein